MTARGAGQFAVIATLFQGMTLGTLINNYSEDTGHSGLVVIAAVSGSLSTAAWIRSLGAGTPLPDFARRAMLGVAVVMIALAVVVPDRYTAPLVLISVAATVTAALIASDVASGARLLASIAFISTGTFAIARVTTPLPAADQHPRLTPVIYLSYAAVLVTLGLARLLGSRTTVGALIIGLGAVAHPAGVLCVLNSLASQPSPRPAAMALLGLTLVTFAVAAPLWGVGHILEHRALSAVGLLAFGFSGAFAATWWLSTGADVLSGALILASAATIALTGAGMLKSNAAFAGWAACGGGALLATMTIRSLYLTDAALPGEVLRVVSLTGFAIAATAWGLAEILRSDQGARLRAWWAGLTQERAH